MSPIRRCVLPEPITRSGYIGVDPPPEKLSTSAAANRLIGAVVWEHVFVTFAGLGSRTIRARDRQSPAGQRPHRGPGTWRAIAGGRAQALPVAGRGRVRAVLAGGRALAREVRAAGERDQPGRNAACAGRTAPPT